MKNNLFVLKNNNKVNYSKTTTDEKEEKYSPKY